MKAFTITIIFLSLFIGNSAAIAQEFRLSAYPVYFDAHYNTELSFLGQSTSFNDSNLNTWGLQFDISYAPSGNLFSGFVYSRIKGLDNNGSEVTVNHYAFSAAYRLSLANDKMKIMPQLAAGPQRFCSVSGTETSYSLVLAQTRYKLIIEYLITDQLFFSSFYEYSHNLYRALFSNSTVLSAGKNLTSQNLGIGLSYYLGS